MDSTAETSMLISMLELYNVNIYSQNKSPRMEKLTEQKSIVENQLESLPDAEMDLFTLNSFTDFLLINGSISLKFNPVLEHIYKENNCRMVVLIYCQKIMGNNRERI